MLLQDHKADASSNFQRYHVILHRAIWARAEKSWIFEVLSFPQLGNIKEKHKASDGNNLFQALISIPEAYSEPWQTFKTKFFAKIFHDNNDDNLWLSNRTSAW